MTVATLIRNNENQNTGISTKGLLVLIFLVVQNSSLVLLMRYTRSKFKNPYLPSTVIVAMEYVKFACCLVTLFFLHGAASFTLLKKIFVNYSDTCKMVIPAALYVIQNNLLYIAITNLDAATFQVSYQLKILTTALFSVILLQKKLNALKWASLIVLSLGVALIHSPEDKGNSKSGQNIQVGFLSVFLACISSGFSGVYFEKVLKDKKSDLWVRNLQLGIFSIIFATGSMFINDGEKIKSDGFFQGYNYLTFGVILLQAAGGLIVALVMKYADNILKAFATSISIVLSMIISMIFLDFEPSILFILGTLLVLLSVYLYSK